MYAMNRPNQLLAALLACGALSSLLYLAADVVGAISAPGYSVRSQAISEMSAIGAPTADLLAPMYTLYSVLFALFGAGVWYAAGERRGLRWSAAFIVGVAALGIGWAMFPMNLRGAERTFTDTMHLVLSGATVLLLAGAIASGAAAFGRNFRFYSVATIVMMLGFGALTAMDAPRLDAGLPTPWLGVNERISMAAWLVWIAVLSLKLLFERSGYRRAA
jgi:hypothetical protein